MSRMGVWAVWMAVLASPMAHGEAVSFRNDVMPVLTRAGCNAGTCHGNQNGKGGFKLSLRGEDAAADYATLTRGQSARRIDPFDPAASLLLRKPATQVAHKGGKRFDAGSKSYDILLRWIEAGAPADGPDVPTVTRLDVTPAEGMFVEPIDRVALRVVAHFSDGSQRDVTDMVGYDLSNRHVKVESDGTVVRQSLGETTVLVRYQHLMAPVRVAFIAARPGFVWADPPANNRIDELVFAKLRAHRINPSALCDDSTFVRRVYLDILGRIPTADEARAFVNDAADDKRTRLIDNLLARPDFADYWALRWADLLRSDERLLDEKGVKVFSDWIRQSIADGKPLDQFARELIAARGSTYENPPANYYRALREPDERAEATAQVFLGTRMRCAKCHNHPFEKWTQDDYYGFAAMFARIDYKIVENNRKDQYDKHQFIGEQIVLMADKGEVKHPRDGEPATPAFLGAPTPTFGESDDRLEALAGWLTSPDNPLFARVLANRIWAQMIGRGVVDPIDDFRASNPPSNPALLDALTEELVGSGFNLRHMIRLIAASRVYQLGVESNETNREDDANFARRIPSRLPAELLLDALHDASGVATNFDGYPQGTRAIQLPGVEDMYRGRRLKDHVQFMRLFGKPPRQVSCDCERTNESTLGQVFELISGPTITRLVADPGNRLASLLESDHSDEQVIDELYWSALSRPATTPERDAAINHVKRAGDRRKGFEDLLWALLNAKEFVLRR